MSEQPGYFFINHTKKEYCQFNNNEPIVNELRKCICENYWNDTEDIRVEFQDSGSTDVWELMGDNGYKDLDEIDGGYDSDGESKDDEMDDVIGTMTKLKVK